jgi:molybdopterin-guanine dinucleotide biosynthesis protein A
MLSLMSTKVHSRAGYVLAGGKSSRMGVNIDKAFLEIGGQTLLERAVSVVGLVCGEVAVVGDPAKFGTKFGAVGMVVADIFPGCGPLGAIHAALVHSSAELNLMLAVDMPFVSREVLAFLFAVAEDEGNHAIVTVPQIGKGLQPLCAVYRREFAVVAEQALREGKYKIDAAFSSVSTRVIEESEVAASGFSERNFFNVNTPQDCLAAEGGDRPR